MKAVNKGHNKTFMKTMYSAIMWPDGHVSLSYTAITAGLELLPEGLYLAQFHLVKGD